MFRSNHFCQTALITIINEWISAIDNNEIAGTLFIDLSKAFDLANYNILLEKLKLYGMHESTVKWFSSYLKDIYQQTYLSGTLSNCCKAVSGVPQCSVLGATLFLVYINDLTLVLRVCIADIVADDSTISAHNKNIDQVASTLSDELQRVIKWCENNLMAINISKLNLCM